MSPSSKRLAVRTVSGVLVRALPLLLLVVIVVFYTVEPFQIAHELPSALIAIAIGLFLLVATLFAAIRLSLQVGASNAESWVSCANAPHRDQPAASVGSRCGRRRPHTPSMSRKEWLNVGLVVMASEAVLVLLVGAAMFVFLVALGLVTVPIELARLGSASGPTCCSRSTRSGCASG